MVSVEVAPSVFQLVQMPNQQLKPGCCSFFALSACSLLRVRTEINILFPCVNHRITTSSFLVLCLVLVHIILYFYIKIKPRWGLDWNCVCLDSRIDPTLSGLLLPLCPFLSCFPCSLFSNHPGLLAVLWVCLICSWLLHVLSHCLDCFSSEDPHDTSLPLSFTSTLLVSLALSTPFGIAYFPPLLATILLAPGHDIPL